jgi:hypothetical protein
MPWILTLQTGFGKSGIEIDRLLPIWHDGDLLKSPADSDI